MYWYISFLRPPPVSVPSTAESIIITPQVANDLRTELKYEPTTIFYKWQRVHPTVLPPPPPQELTIFEPPASTYKPLSVLLPPKIQAGESWRLGLFAPSSEPERERDEDNQGEGCSSLLSLMDDHPPVLGVWSEGIQIIRPDIKSSGITKSVNGKNATKRDTSTSTSNASLSKGQDGHYKGKGKGKEKEKDDGPKQGRITREFKLPSEFGLTSASDCTLRIVEQTSFDLDKKIWDSGLALSAWLWRNLPRQPRVKTSHTLADRLIELVRRETPLRILELGSGTGLVSIALALALKSHCPDSPRYITATDLDSAIPLMNENLSLNDLTPIDLPSGSTSNGGNTNTSANVRLDAKVLDWDEPTPSWVSDEWLQPELIIAADVTYNTSAFPSLLSTLTSLLDLPADRQQPNQAKPLLLLAYKQRDPAERDLWDMLKEKGVGMVLVDKVKGAEEEGETEIWIGGIGLDL